MNVAELIEELKKYSGKLPVRFALSPIEPLMEVLSIYPMAYSHFPDHGVLVIDIGGDDE